jgi:HEAT repeat protein
MDKEIRQMTKIRFATKTFLVLATAAALLGSAGVAQAGRGGSHARIQNAMRTGSSAALIAEIERAERLICSSACIDTMMSLLEDSRYEVREAAGWWFARRAAQRAELRDRALADLQGSDSIAARNAADMLGAFRDATSLPALEAAAQRQDLDPEARQHAVRALGLIRALDASPVLAAAMRDSSAAVRLEAVNAWYQITGQTGAQPVIALLADADVEVRRKAASVAGALREAGARTALEQRLASDEDSLVRRHAAWALGAIGDAASRPALEAAQAGDASSLVRGTAKVALRQLR